MVDGALVRASTLSVNLGVGKVVVVTESCVRPSYSCDGCVCDLGTVVSSSIFGLISGAGAFAVVLPDFVLVSRMQLTQQYRKETHVLFNLERSHDSIFIENREVVLSLQF